jgi:hypothetical protein
MTDNFLTSWATISFSRKTRLHGGNISPQRSIGTSCRGFSTLTQFSLVRGHQLNISNWRLVNGFKYFCESFNAIILLFMFTAWIESNSNMFSAVHCGSQTSCVFASALLHFTLDLHANITNCLPICVKNSLQYDSSVWNGTYSRLQKVCGNCMYHLL